MTNQQKVEFIEAESILSVFWPGGDKSRREMLAKFRTAFLKKCAKKGNKKP